MAGIEQLSDAPFELSALRKFRGLTQSEMAKAVGVSKVTYAKWEAGNFGKAKFGKAIKVAETLGVRLEMIKF